MKSVALKQQIGQTPVDLEGFPWEITRSNTREEY